jgi:hypothetical protein
MNMGGGHQLLVYTRRETDAYASVWDSQIGEQFRTSSRVRYPPRQDLKPRQDNDSDALRPIFFQYYMNDFTTIEMLRQLNARGIAYKYKESISPHLFSPIMPLT